MTSNKKLILSILGLCLILRLLFLIAVQPWAYSIEGQLDFCRDSPLYHHLACNMLDHQRFAASAVAEPDPLRTPIYPAFVAGIYGIFGRIPSAVFIVQILLDTLSCFLLFWTLRRLINRKVALIAAFFYAIDPYLILFSSALLTETLFVFFLVVTLSILGWILSREGNKRATLGYGLLGFIIGLATLIRPISLYLPVLLVGFLLIAYRKKLGVALKYSAALAVVFLLVISPWLIRNYTLFGSASLTYIDSWDLLALNVGAMEAGKRHQDMMTTRIELLAEADSLMIADGFRPEDLNLMEKADYWRPLAFRYILRDPVHFAIAHARGTIFVFANLGTSDFAHALHLPSHSVGDPLNFLDVIHKFFTRKSPTEIFFAALLVPLLLVTYLGLAFGLIIAWRRYDKTFLAVCLLITFYFVAIPGALGLVRFKLPALPFFLPFVGIGIAYLLDCLKARKFVAVNPPKNE